MISFLRRAQPMKKVLIAKNMFRVAKAVSCMMLVALGCQKASAFSLLGPANEAFQQGGRPNELDYNFADDIGAPKNIGEEYRWNLPTLYYAFDQSFLDYFGSNGVAAVEQAISVFNALTNVSSYSADLSEFPQEELRFNAKASALFLYDLKSMTMNALIEEMGLAEPDRYTWTLRNRFLPPGNNCPFYEYLVIKRNFDPVTWEPSSYVNGTLYTYAIIEGCPTISRADASEVRVDPTQPGFTAVASRGLFASFLDGSEADEGFLRYGFFSTGLTRDDVGGLRYLLRKSNVNWESSDPNSLAFTTNSPQLLTTVNLALLQAQALTNNPGALQTLFPNLVINTVSNTFSVQAITNFIPVFTNEPWLPADLFQIQFVTNITLVPVTQFQYTFANVVTFQLVNGQWVAVPVTSLNTQTNHTITQVLTTVATNAAFSPGGSNTFLVQNFVQNFATNTVTGEFFLLPTNACAVSVIAPLLTNVIANSNIIGFATNFNGEFIVQSTIDYFTNHTFVVSLINCTPSNPALHQGVEKISFVRHDFDSLVGRFYQPITNYYHLTEITNSQAIDRTFLRVVTQPDVLFSAADLVSPAGPGGPIVPNIFSRTEFAGGHVDTANANPGLAGPGVIYPQLNIIYNKIGPMFDNLGPGDESSGFFVFQWGSFDGSTNEPIVYPNGTSIMNMENQILMQVATGSITNAVVGEDFSQTIQGLGGTTPYTFTLTPTSLPLPAGLNLAPSGVVSGTPTAAGNFEVNVLMTDAGGRSVSRFVTITVSP